VSTPGPDLEKQADRRLQLRLAVATSVVVALSSLGGVYLGAVFQTKVQKEVTDAQNEQSSRSYLRDQRRQVYGELLGANRQLLAVEQDILIPGARAEPTTLEDLANARVVRRSYYLAEDLVKVVGPTELLTMIARLRGAHVTAATLMSETLADPERTEKDKRHYRQAMNDCWDLTLELGPQLRKILGANE
jgi:hypothetical protein